MMKFSRKYEKSGNDCDKVKWKYFAKSARRAKRNDVESEEKHILSPKNTKQKVFWSFLRKNLSVEKSIPNLKVNDEIVSDNNVKASCFNTFFSTVFIKDDGKILDIDGSKNIKFSNEIVFDPNEVFIILSKLEGKTCSGPDKIPQKMLKSLAFELSYPLTRLFNLSYATGTVPQIWKDAIVVPVHKKGSKCVVGNYRPISLTSELVKVMEIKIRSKMLSHLSAHGVLTDSQHGFRSMRYTVSQMLCCLNKWTKALDEHKRTDVIYLDIATAFDSVSHPKLLQKLKGLNFCSTLIKWVESYLSDR